MEYMWNIYGIQLSMEYDEYDRFKCPFQEPKLEGTYNVQVLRQGIPPGKNWLHTVWYLNSMILKFPLILIREFTIINNNLFRDPHDLTSLHVLFFC